MRALAMSDLRVNNYVAVLGPNFDERIKGFVDGKIIFHGNSSADFDSCRTIDLDKRWLDSFGVKRLRAGLFIHTETGKKVKSNKPILYVHQLQTLFYVNEEVELSNNGLNKIM